jgi:tetratricopeptide (TPR) repeat protein
MRRLLVLSVFLFLIVAPAQAQFGKTILLAAGSPEDKALQEITNTTDAAKKLELLDKWLADFGKGDMAILAYEIYLSHYAAAKDYDKAFEYGERILQLDPDSFSTSVNLVQLAQQKGDAAKLVEYGERIGAILQRYKAKPAPEGTDAELWRRQKEDAFASVAGTVQSVEYAMYTASYQAPEPAARAALLERFVSAFPSSAYAPNARVMVADAYQQARQPQKMVAFAQKVLKDEPDNFSMMNVLADYWATQKEQLEQAEEYAKKAAELAEKAEKPEGIAAEEWEKQKSLQTGLAWSALGQIHVHKNRDAQAVEALKTASPLLKPYDYYYGRNLYFLGFVLARMKRTAEARPVLSEAASVNSPYKTLAEETLAKIGGAAPAKKAAGKKRP